MEMNIEALMSRLAAGEDVQTIADEAAAIINEASHKFQEKEEAKKKKEEEELAKLKATNSKREEVEEIAGAAAHLLLKYWPNIVALAPTMDRESWDALTAASVDALVAELDKEDRRLGRKKEETKVADPFVGWFKMIM